jgi:hypothetical protein
MPDCKRVCAEAFSTALPLKNTRPEVGRLSPAKISNNVLFPAPFGPMSPVKSPGASDKETASRTCTPPKRIDTVAARNSEWSFRSKSSFTGSSFFLIAAASAAALV